MYKHKSHSRSPFSSKSPISSSQVPSFQPPSFYAAAAGIPYLPKSNSSSSTAEERREIGHSSGSQTVMTPMVPISYPTQAGMQDVSPNIVPVEPKDPHLSRSGSTSSSRKSISLTRSLSRALPRYNRGDKEKQANGKRKSQLVDIPFLETQLLPSLRDTIDRMTQPPRVRFPEDDESRVSPPDVGFSTMKSTSPYPQSPWASFQSHLDAPLSQQLPSISPRPPTHAPFGQLESFSSPSQNSCVSTFTRIPKSPMTRPSPSVTDSPRKPLKSALRAPTPSSLLTPIATHSTPNIPSPSFNSKSLRSVRSMVGGFSTRSPGEKQASSKSPGPQHIVNSPPDSQRDSQTKHSTKYKSKPRSHSETPRSIPKPVPAHESSGLPASSTYSLSHRSGIPRPTFIPTTQSNDSGTELERRYERAFTGGRLVVTNTTVVPSSSESEDGEIQRERWRRRSNTWTSQIRPHTEREKVSDQGLYTPKPPPNPTPSRHDSRNFDVGPPKSTRVGLGLKLTHGEVRDDRAQETDEDDESIYDDEASLQGSDVDNGQERDHRFPGIASHRLATGRQTSIDYDPACNLRRQEALLGIVNGLQQDFRLSVSPKGRGRLSHSDSDGTYVSQGIAIGASGDLCLNSPRTSFGRDPRPREDCQQGKGVEGKSFSYENGPNNHQSVRKSVLMEETTRRDDSYRRDVDSSTRSKRNSKRRSSSVPASSRPSRMYASEIANRLQENHCPPQHDEHLCRGAHQRPHHHLVDKPETAVREREGFGIPPSLSYGAREECEGIHTPTSAINQLNEDPKSQIRLEEQSPSELPHFDSESSSVGGNWRGSGEAGHWTVGAEALFRQLSTCSTNGNERPRMGRRDLPSDSYTVGSRAWDPGPRRDKALHQTRLVHQRSPSIISASSSAPSVYDVPSAPQDPVDSSRTIFEETDIQGSWQATMRQSTYKAFLTEYGAEELGRQELIYQFFCSEEDFVIRLRAVVELFILPLRQKDSRKWLPGIPCRVSRLFDWLDDIQSLHTAIANTLKTSLRVWKTGGVVIRFAEALRGFIPRLEIYQPYLARVDEVRELVDACANDHNDEFGEYVRLREDEYGAEGWSLLKLLDEPVQHLSRYTSIFLTLWKHTPKNHSDHLPLLSLCYSTAMVLRVLREVRLREQEYEFVKDIASNIESLPSAHLLAQRERRLLWHGAASIDVHSFPKVNASSKIDSRPSSSDIRDSRPKGPTWQRSSRLFDVIGSRGNQRHHLPSSGSSSSFPSSESFETSSSVPSTCASEVYHRTGNNAPRIVVEGCSSEDIAAHAAAGGKSILVGRNTIQLLVFMDIVVLSTPSTFSREPHKFVDARWKLLEGYGFSRLFGIIDNAEGSITLELLPLSPSQLQTGVIDGETRLSSVTISLSPDTLPTERSALLAALQESHKHTVLSLSFPSFSNTYLTHGPSVDLELDTQRSLKAIMDSGLPLPKSPSVQEWEKMSKTSTRAEDGPNHFDDPVEGERQERGWWTLRFQQVLREMQRKEPTIAMDLDIHMKTTRTGARI